MAQAHESFQFIRSEMINSLGIEMSEYEHKATGAKHFHLATDYDENVFLVAFRTMPEDSTGVAHILEHTALCGSERFPVRDPFFMMTRRSLNTFMNAFTSSDWTAYPFASQNRKDFFNLLDVYLDAAFFPRLDPLDFAQEGHRVELAEAGNPESDLLFKGVVFNEMKGAMSSTTSVLWQTVSKYLFPTTTYHYNSGGEPADIPDLTYDQLKAFHETHYHPSNAIVMTFGDIPVDELQRRFEEQAFNRFERLDSELSVPDEKRYFAPIKVEEAYPLDQGETEGKTHHVIGWLTKPSIDLKAELEGQLLSRVLLDNSSSPLRAALESTDLGAAPSPLCGIEDSNREMSFLCGIEGSEPERAAQFEQLVLDTLQEVVDQGVDPSVVAAQLHQLELQQREITGDHYPFGMSLILASLSNAIHRGDAIASLNIDSVLDQLREEIKDPQFIPNLVKTWLLDNPHRVLLTLRPDTELSQRKDQAEADRLAQYKQSLSREALESIDALAKQLEERQTQADDPSLLPKVTLEDVPVECHFPVGDQVNDSTTWFTAGTNGIVYQQLLFDLPELTARQQTLLPLYTQCLTELGSAGRTYKEHQALESAISGGISASINARAATDDATQLRAILTLSGKGLVVNQAALSELMADMLVSAPFNETARIAELLNQNASRKEQSVTGQGHSLAILAASAGLAPGAGFSHASRGLPSIKLARELADQSSDESQLNALAEELRGIHQVIMASSPKALLVADSEHKESCLRQFEKEFARLSSGSIDKPFQVSTEAPVKQQAWIVNTQVNFCAKVFRTVTVAHPDAAALTVAGEILRNGYLHRAIREQGGAYGSGASQDSGDGLFRFYSYRDPNSIETINHFDQSVAWLLDGGADSEKLEEAILGVISSIDKPGSPAGEAKATYLNALFGRTPEQRMEYRSRVLAVTLGDIERVVNQYLSNPEEGYEAIVTSAKTAETLSDNYQRFSL
ncbi:insulinase family protein [Marinobacterium sp. xm-d-509]|uniref:insulinase family protein n=1 Tax=unclassified Marinobacterium TaxID=2644139 RepID=UPI001A07F6F7|nr:Peptidase M16C associated [Marinobacterium sp. xm-g-48]NRP83063.1 Peptidase M16C associated [Marinobacterium sp. xm-d-509]